MARRRKTSSSRCTASNGDFDGHGKTDLGAYRPSTGYWYILLSSTNYTTYVAQTWGLDGDMLVLRRE